MRQIEPPNGEIKNSPMGIDIVSPVGNIIGTMKLKPWLDAESGRAVGLAAALKVYPSFVSKMANGNKPVPFERCMPIELHTHGEVSRRDLRPDDFQIHWPELAEAQAEPAQAAIKYIAPDASDATGSVHHA